MSKRVIGVFLWVLSVATLAEEQFYYFAKVVDGELHYTRILRCATAAATVSDARFGVTDAVGPIQDFQTAEASLRQALKRARSKGVRVKLSEGKCLTP